MVTLGDVFTVIAILFGVCFTGWALIMGAALLFQSGASRAKDAYRLAPWKGFGLGLVATFVLVIAGLVIVRVPAPGAKLLGTSMFLILMSLSAMGSAGIAMVIAERISALDPAVTPYAAMLRASTILVVAGVFPILGWFLVGPCLVIASAGYGLRALVSKQSSMVLAPPVER